ncbi:MAG: YdcF family protein [Gammaproteobacteria bacterium]|nr:MAG: YdcF family protein [Gammaproteobacteria bacterium]
MVELGPKIWGLLLTPPGVIVLVVLVGLLLQLRWRALGGIVVLVSIAVLFALSLPFTGRALIAPLEATASALPAATLTPEDAKKQADAIVVLGGGRYARASEYGDTDAVNEATLHRLRYAAWLYRRTGLPILVTGGAPFGEETAEALLMQAALEEDFQVRPKWAEARSRNTHENAVLSKEILAAAGVRRVYLVTHAWHMPRAQWAFINAGFDVVPAPMGFSTLGKGEREGLGYLPSMHGLALSTLALRERLGLTWYKYKYKIQSTVLPETKPATAKP